VRENGKERELQGRKDVGSMIRKGRREVVLGVQVRREWSEGQGIGTIC